MNAASVSPPGRTTVQAGKGSRVSTEYLKNDEIEDPSYGMDRMDYVEEMRQKGGRRESLDLEEMLRKIRRSLPEEPSAKKQKTPTFRQS